jgi:hypothetical protein
MPKESNRYTKLIEAIFTKHYRKSVTEFEFERDEIVQQAKLLNVKLPKNLGDVLYTFRYRAELPESITSTAPANLAWIIRPAGRGRYRFVLASQAIIVPSERMAVTKIPDSTPGIIARYALNDEQAVLAKIRYNRLVDIFTGITCYSLQNHLRTTMRETGQVETDEIYVGVDKRGVHYVMPVQAKGQKDKVGIVQIEQDLMVCASKFPGLICRPIAAQLIGENLIALFELEETEDGIGVTSERHYKLVNPRNLTNEELSEYQKRLT